MIASGAVTGSLLAVNLIDAWLYGSLLAAVAVALTLVFGLGRVVNFAIGSFYALGAYVAYTLPGRWATGWRFLFAGGRRDVRRVRRAGRDPAAARSS